MARTTEPVPAWEGATVVVEPPEVTTGSWAGAPSAVLVDGTFYLAYRLRMPIGEGRGYANMIAKSRFTNGRWEKAVRSWHTRPWHRH